MYASFDNMPDSSRIWVYQSNRKLSRPEQEKISGKVALFLEEWAAHGSDLKASFKFSHDYFLILAVDEKMHMASGCSIDASVGFIKSLANEFNIDFFDRNKIAFIFNDEIFFESLVNIKNQIQTGGITESMLLFNNAITTKGELEKSWIVPVADSWAGRYFQSVTG